MIEKIINKIHLVALNLAFIGLLFPIKISSACVIFFALTSLIKLIFFKTEKNTVQKKIALFFLNFFGLYIFGLIYTQNFAVAKGILERNISWLLVPLFLFFTISFKNKKSFIKTLLPFAISTQLFAVFYLLVAIYNFYLSSNNVVFYYTHLTKITNFHPVYFAVYLLFSNFILLSYLAEISKKKQPLIFLVFALFNFILLILLSSKSVLITSLIFIIIYLTKYLKLKRKLFLLPLLLIAFFAAIFSFKITKDRINKVVYSNWELLNKDQFLYNDSFTGTTLRLITSKLVTKKMFSENTFLIGVGTGDAQDFINNVYIEHNMDAAGYLNFNMHNQFLEYFVRFGFLGLFYFLGILYLGFKKAFISKNKLYLWFLILFVITSLTESTLEVHRGIVFFTLFNFIFYFNTFSIKLRK